MLSSQFSRLAATNENPRAGCESTFSDFTANELRWSCVDDKLRNCQFHLADSIILCREMKSHFTVKEEHYLEWIHTCRKNTFRKKKQRKTWTLIFKWLKERENISTLLTCECSNLHRSILIARFWSSGMYYL